MRFQLSCVDGRGLASLSLLDPVPLDEYLALARRNLERVPASELDDAIAAGELVVDVRPLELRDAQGPIPGAVVIGLNVLEWRLAPSSESRMIDLDSSQRVILICHQGYSSSLAAARLRDLGLNATDVIGGFEAWTASRHL